MLVDMECTNGTLSIKNDTNQGNTRNTNLLGLSMRLDSKVMSTRIKHQFRKMTKSNKSILNCLKSIAH